MTKFTTSLSIVMAFLFAIPYISNSAPCSSEIVIGKWKAVNAHLLEPLELSFNANSTMECHTCDEGDSRFSQWYFEPGSYPGTDRGQYRHIYILSFDDVLNDSYSKQDCFYDPGSKKMMLQNAMVFEKLK